MKKPLRFQVFFIKKMDQPQKLLDLDFEYKYLRVQRGEVNFYANTIPKTNHKTNVDFNALRNPKK